VLKRRLSCIEAFHPPSAVSSCRERWRSLQWLRQGLACAADPAPFAKRHNLLFLFTKGQRADALSLHGDKPLAQTPNIDRMRVKVSRFEMPS
jgi:hypothetical protein